MDKRIDIRVTAAYINANNDIEIYESDEDHIQATIAASPGSYKQHPQDGVNIDSFLSSAGQETVIARRIIVQLKSDGYRVDNPIISFDPNGKLSINPNATR